MRSSWVERTFDRTSVRFLARMFDDFKTRLEQMFETPARTPYAEVMSGSQSGPTDNAPSKRRSMSDKSATDAVVHELPDRDHDDGTLTVRQRKVLDVIRNSVDRRGYPPSMREIGQAVGLTS